MNPTQAMYSAVPTLAQGIMILVRTLQCTKGDVYIVCIYS